MVEATCTPSITVTLPQIAKVIDHSLLDPTLSDGEVLAGLRAARRLHVAAVCVKPCNVEVARDFLSDSGVAVCAAVGGFPHGSTTTAVKVLEAETAVRDGATEIDLVVNIGKIRGGDWEYAANEIQAVRDAIAPTSPCPTIDLTISPSLSPSLGMSANAAHGHSTGVGIDHLASSTSSIGSGGNGAVLKVIFETAFLDDAEIVRLCQICSALSVGFVKTSTGFGFVKVVKQQPEWSGMDLYASHGATVHHIRLMKASVGPGVQVKAAGGIRTLDQLLLAMAAGATRVGTSATEAILKEARARGIGATPVRVTLPFDAGAD